MELDGHPTQDLVEELERRGAIRYWGSSLGPQTSSRSGASGEVEPGIWLFLMQRAYDTEIDEGLPLS